MAAIISPLLAQAISRRGLYYPLNVYAYHIQVINDILDYSKLEAGKMQMFAERMNLVQTINEVVRALSFTNSKERVETVQRVHLDPKLYVIGDPVRLHQCFMNLISKYAAETFLT